MKLNRAILEVFFCQLAVFAIIKAANIEMYVNSATKVAVDLDLTNTFGLKFCIRSDHGLLLTFQETKGVYNPFKRYQVEIGDSSDKNCIRAIPASSVQARNYYTDTVDFVNAVCFWTTWADNWYFVGKGTDFGQNLMMNYKNQTQTPIGGLFVQTKAAGQQAYLTIIDQTITKADAQSKAASTLAVTQWYAGPISLTNQVDEITTTTITTTAGAAYQDLGIDATKWTGFSFKATSNTQLFGPYIAVGNKDVDFTNTAVEFNMGRYQAAYSIGKGIDQTTTFNLNNKDFTPTPNGTVYEYWISWASGRFAAGPGSTVGVNTVVAWDNPSALTVNCIKIRSKDMPVTWTIPNRYYA